MNRTALFAALAFAVAAPAFAQQAAPQNAPIAETPTADAPAASGMATTGHSTTVYHGPHRYAMHTRGGAGDPKIVDHSADTLVVTPTHTTITIPPPR
jgi:hypothetical protein